MERKSYKPLAISLGLMVLASIVIATTVGVRSSGETGIVLDADGNPLLPLRIGAWEGELQEITEGERNALPDDTRFARMIYRDPSGASVICSLVLSGADRGSIHRPEVCLPAQGWEIHNSDVVSIPLDVPAGHSLRARRLLISKKVKTQDGQDAEIFRYNLYWFVGRDMTTSEHGHRIVRATLDRVLHNINHRWAYVTVAPLWIPPGKEKEVQALLSQFIRESFSLYHKPDVIPG